MGEKRKCFYYRFPIAFFLKRQPKINKVKKRYSINFKDYSILIWHPVNSEVKNLKKSTLSLLMKLDKFNQNFVVINPNNDPGYKIILNS